MTTLATTTTTFDIPAEGEGRNKSIVALRSQVSENQTLRLLLNGLEQQVNGSPKAQRLSVTYRTSTDGETSVDSFSLALADL